MATEIIFFNDQGEPAPLKFSEEITTNPFRRAMNSYLSDLQYMGTLAERLDSIYEKVLSGEGDQVDLLQQYYYLGARLVEIEGSLEETTQSEVAQDELQNRIEGRKGKESWRIALRAYQLYHVRGFSNLLENKYITANVLYRMNKEDFQELIDEARRISAEEVLRSSEETFTGAQK
ncbi:28963_t:CDS:2 [Gigaspora margarita]|uniref:28963_t:CDS:1 n=1 Tax=Gigaspora margarita TaxID=4874 RepID=A0ABN7W2G1_GIGMA|nr:28963_t:CDS:2 [Gigaspora margarita]